MKSLRVSEWEQEKEKTRQTQHDVSSSSRVEKEEEKFKRNQRKKNHKMPCYNRMKGEDVKKEKKKKKCSINKQQEILSFFASRMISLGFFE